MYVASWTVNMSYSQLTCILLLVLCGNALGKAVMVDISDSENSLRGLQTEGGGQKAEEINSEDKNNSCVYKGKVFTINVTTIAEKFK